MNCTHRTELGDCDEKDKGVFKSNTVVHKVLMSGGDDSLIRICFTISH